MIDFQELSKEELAENGIVFETAEEADQFVDFILEEYEVRIGAAIAEGQTQEALREFDETEGVEEARAWLKKHRPDYRKVVKEIGAELSEEVIKYKDRITG